MTTGTVNRNSSNCEILPQKRFFRALTGFKSMGSARSAHGLKAIFGGYVITIIRGIFRVGQFFRAIFCNCLNFDSLRSSHDSFHLYSRSSHNFILSDNTYYQKFYSCFPKLKQYLVLSDCVLLLFQILAVPTSQPVGNH